MVLFQPAKTAFSWNFKLVPVGWGEAVSSRPAHPQHLFSSTLTSQLLAFTVLLLSCSLYPQAPAALWGFAWWRTVLSSPSLWIPLPDCRRLADTGLGWLCCKVRIQWERPIHCVLLLVAETQSTTPSGLVTLTSCIFLGSY